VRVSESNVGTPQERHLAKESEKRRKIHFFSVKEVSDKVFLLAISERNCFGRLRPLPVNPKYWLDNGFFQPYFMRGVLESWVLFPILLHHRLWHSPIDSASPPKGNKSKKRRKIHFFSMKKSNKKENLSSVDSLLLWLKCEWTEAGATGNFFVMDFPERLRELLRAFEAVACKPNRRASCSGLGCWASCQIDVCKLGGLQSIGRNWLAGLDFNSITKNIGRVRGFLGGALRCPADSEAPPKKKILAR
jgi:hypothetical protein